MIFHNPASILLVSALILIQFLLLTNSQGNTVFSNVCNLEYYFSPYSTHYFFPTETVVTMNGSSSTGRRSSFIISNSTDTNQ